MSPVPAIQRFSEDKLTAIRIVAQVQPVIDLAPILRAPRDGGSRFPSVDTADHDVYAIQPSQDALQGIDLMPGQVRWQRVREP